MSDSVRVIPIECKFGRTSAFAYYIDAPEPALIDTGIASSASQEIEPELKKHGLNITDIRWILLTHGHVDHLGGARAVWEKTDRRAKVVIPRQEAYLLRNRSAHLADYKQLQGRYVDAEMQAKHAAMLLGDIGEDLEPTMEVAHGDRLSLGGDVSITVVETPGHSIGSVTFVLDGMNWAFAADAVQMCGGVQSGIPTIESPALYRRSLQLLLEEVRPQRLYLGHRFRGAGGGISGPAIEGDAVAAALAVSLEMDGRLADIVRRHLQEDRRLEGGEGLYGPFGPVAEEIGYTGDPRHLPCAFFVTMHGYSNELAGVRK